PVSLAPGDAAHGDGDQHPGSGPPFHNGGWPGTGSPFGDRDAPGPDRALSCGSDTAALLCTPPGHHPNVAAWYRHTRANTEPLPRTVWIPRLPYVLFRHRSSF